MSRNSETKNKAKGKRYSEDERAEVLSFVQSVNNDRGRGGITSAAEKFGITPLTISNWMKSRGVPSSRSKGSSKDFTKNLHRMADLHEAIIKAETELKGLEKEYAKLKSAL